MSAPETQAAPSATWRVTTESGSVHVFEFHDDADTVTVRRDPGPDAGELRRDAEPVPLLEVPAVLVGWPIRMVIDVRGDGVLTVRTTTPVVSIETTEAAR